MRIAGPILGLLWAAVIMAAAVHFAPPPDLRDRNTINGTWPYRLQEVIRR